MEFIADLHIHSYLSRATAKDLNLEHLNLWAQLKGIRVVATGDFTHPQWLSELSEKLEPAEEGLFKLKPAFAAETAPMVPPGCQAPVRFILSVEISSIYKKGEKTRKVHNVVLAPGLEVAKKIHERLARIGNVASDGRPILGLDSKRLLEIVLEVSSDIVFIPAHIWTPWFSVLGSKSGFDSIKECFDDLTPEIFSVETGLSADPAMIWRLSSLDQFTLVSNSDAHSPSNLGREANLFDTDLSYFAIREALRTGDPRRFLGTLEYFPEEGKYHFDGHRKCGVRLSPRETIKYKGLCPVCGKPVTVGVMHRVEELADREIEQRPKGRHPFTSLLPLTDVLSEVLQVGPKSKKVNEALRILLEKCGCEFEILRKTPVEALDRHGPPLLSEAIKRMRNNQVQIAPGYDGEFGTVSLFTEEERQHLFGQERLFAMPSKDKAGAHRRAPQPSLFETGKSFRSGGQTPPSLRYDAMLLRNGKTVFATPNVFCTEETGGLRRKRQKSLAEPADASSQRSSLGPEGLLDNLNEAQQEAVQHVGGPLLIVAGPGTGKTRTLTHRIGYLLSRGAAQPEQVLAVTFTNKAAQEMAKRLSSIVHDVKVLESITIKTFHALCLDIISCEGGVMGMAVPISIVNEADRKDLVKEAMQQAGDNVSGGKGNPDKMLHLISLAKQRMLSPEDGLSNAVPASFPSRFSDIYRTYQRLLARDRLLDFDDLIFRVVKLFDSDEALRKKYHQKFTHISVDEYQDINYAQYRLIRLLTSPSHDICVIGDPDQAIYGFRGADVRYFHSFCEDYPGAKRISLVQNYRSTKTILQASGQVMGADGTARETKGIWSGIDGPRALTIAQLPTERAEAEYIVKTVEEEVGGISHFSVDSGRVNAAKEKERTFGDFAVLYRVKEQAKAIKEAFKRSGMPYETVGDEKLETRRGIRECISYLKVGLSAESNVDVERILNFPPRGISQANVDALKKWSETSGIPLMAALNRAREIAGLKPKAQVRLMALSEDLKKLRDQIKDQDVHEQIQIVVDRFNIMDEMSHDATFEENLTTFLTLSKSFPGDSAQFLAHLALETEQDLYAPEAESVVLTTMHAAKGLEFPVVFVVGCEDGLIPYRRKEDDEDLEEERRLFYVALTRAQNKIFLTHAAKRTRFGKRKIQHVSPFLQAIEEDLKQHKRPFSTKPPRKKEDAQLSLFT